MSAEKIPASSGVPAETNAKPPRKKFKYTRQLVQIALDDGMTQKEIADACRTQQSVVSKWKKGESRGTEEQLASLFKKYGQRLNRTTSRLYRVMDAHDARWENTEGGQQLLALFEQGHQLQHSNDPAAVEQHRVAVEQLWHTTFPANGPIWNWYDPLGMLVERWQVVFASTFPTKVTQVEGPVIFRYSFTRFEPHADRRGIDVSRVPVSRWMVHDGQFGKLILVRQYRARLMSDGQEQWVHEIGRVAQSVQRLAENVKAKEGTVPHILPAFWLEAADDAAKWVCRIEAPMTAEQLLTFADEYIQDFGQIHNPHDELVFPFLLRKALVEQGHQVAGIEKISGSD